MVRSESEFQSSAEPSLSFSLLRAFRNQLPSSVKGEQKKSVKAREYVNEGNSPLIEVALPSSKLRLIPSLATLTYNLDAQLTTPLHHRSGFGTSVIYTAVVT